MQMLVYGLAAETALQQEVKSLSLYFLRSGTAYSFDFDQPARRRAVTLVNQAIQRYQRQAADQKENGPGPPGPANSARTVPPSHFGKSRQPMLPGFSQGGD
jgi:hypothetical protein